MSLILTPSLIRVAKLGNYQVMALLDVDHSYAYNGEGEGDLASAVVKIESLNPADTDSVKLVEFQSPALTQFWRRPIHVRAGVALPPSYGKDAKKSYATVYHAHGFGGDHTAAWRQGA